MGIDRYINEGITTPAEFHQLVESLIDINYRDPHVFTKTVKGCPISLLHLTLKDIKPEESTLKLLQSINVDFNVTDRQGNSLLNITV